MNDDSIQSRLPSRFFSEAAFSQVSGGYAITLDGKALKTPAKNPMIIPTEPLAREIAGEWAAQGEKINPATMALTRIAGTAIDKIAPDMGAVVDGVLKYAETDLLCHFAESPPELLSRQKEQWGAILQWADKRLGAKMQTTTGIIPVRQPESAIAALRAGVEEMGPMELAGFAALVGASGSLLLALALRLGEIDAAGVYALAHLDDEWQAEKWGDDALARARLNAINDEINYCARFMQLARG